MFAAGVRCGGPPMSIITAWGGNSHLEDLSTSRKWNLQGARHDSNYQVPCHVVSCIGPYHLWENVAGP